MTTTRTMDWTPRERLLTGLCVISLGFSIAAYFDFGGSAGAAPRGDDPITSADIPRGTIRGSDIARETITSADVRNGSLRARDLDIYLAFGTSAFISAATGFTNTSQVDCLRGSQVVSGAYTISNPNTVVVNAFVPGPTPGPAPGGRWTVQGTQTGQAPAFVQANAVCMK